MSNNPWDKPEDSANPWNQPSGNQWSKPDTGGANQGNSPVEPPRDSGKDVTDPDFRSSNPYEDWEGLANAPQPPTYARNVAPTPPPNANYQQGYPPQQYAQQQYPQQEEKKSGKGWWIALAILVVLILIGAGLWWFLAGSKGDEPSDEPVTVYETEYEDSPEEEEDEDEDEDGDRDSEPSGRPESHPNAPSQARSSSDYPRGLSASGWDSETNAQCNSSDDWVYAATNRDTYVAICENPDNGRLYYRGHSGGMGYEDDVAGTSDVARGQFRVPAAPNTIVIDGKTLKVIGPDGAELDSQRLDEAYYQR